MSRIEVGGGGAGGGGGSGTSSPSVIGWVNVYNNDDNGGTPEFPLLDIGGAAVNRRMTLGGRAYLASGDGFAIQLTDCLAGFTLLHADIFVADATGANSAWYAAADLTVTPGGGAQVVPLDGPGGVTTGAGVALNVGGDQVNVTPSGVYDFRIRIAAYIA